MRALVTGGVGFVGRRVVNELLQRRIQVRCLVRTDYAAQALIESRGVDAKDLEVVVGDLSHPDRSLAAHCDVVYHLASAGTGSCASMFANNVTATRKFVAAIEQSDIKSFVLVSSLGVYGASTLRRGAILDEMTPVDPNPQLRDAYSFSKVVQEQVLWSSWSAGKLPLVVVRPGVVYGPGRSPLTARVGLQIGRLFLCMGGRQPLPYTYVENCADAIVSAGLTTGVEGRVYNIVDDELPTGNQIIRTFRKSRGRTWVLRIPRGIIPILAGANEWYARKSRGQIPAVITKYRAAAQWKYLRFPNTRAKSDLNWSPSVSLADGIHRTLLYLHGT